MLGNFSVFEWEAIELNLTGSKTALFSNLVAEFYSTQVSRQFCRSLRKVFFSIPDRMTSNGLTVKRWMIFDWPSFLFRLSRPRYTYDASISMSASIRKRNFCLLFVLALLCRTYVRANRTKKEVFLVSRQTNVTSRIEEKPLYLCVSLCLSLSRTCESAFRLCVGLQSLTSGNLWISTRT